jgi:hypothetical protein
MNESRTAFPRRFRPPLLFSALALGIACGGMTDPPVGPPPGAHLTVQTELWDAGTIPASGDAPVLSIYARLDVDRRPSSELAVSGETLTIGGVALTPDARDEDGLTYQRRLAPPAAYTSEGIELTGLPTIEGLVAPVPTTPFFGPRRLDPDTVRITPDEDLRLHVVMAGARGTTASRAERWVLQLGIEGGTPVEIAGSGPPPATLVAPRNLLPSALGAPFTALLRYQLYAGSEQPYGPGDVYRLTQSMATTLRWVVLVAGAEQ